MKLQFRNFLKTRKPQKEKPPCIIKPQYWIKYYGIDTPLPNYLSDKLFEYNYVKVKDGYELEFTEEALDKMK